MEVLLKFLNAINLKFKHFPLAYILKDIRYSSQPSFLMLKLQRNQANKQILKIS